MLACELQYYPHPPSRAFSPSISRSTGRPCSDLSSRVAASLALIDGKIPASRATKLTRRQRHMRAVALEVGSQHSRGGNEGINQINEGHNARLGKYPAMPRLRQDRIIGRRTSEVAHWHCLCIAVVMHERWPAAIHKISKNRGGRRRMISRKAPITTSSRELSRERGLTRFQPGQYNK